VLAAVMVVSLKLLIKILYQNFWIKGEMIIVREVMKSARKIADYAIFLKCINNIPKPITVKMAVMINKLLYNAVD